MSKSGNVWQVLTREDGIKEILKYKVKSVFTKCGAHLYQRKKICELVPEDGELKGNSVSIKAKFGGVVTKLSIKLGDIISIGDSLIEIKICAHPTILSNMCCDCGIVLESSSNQAEETPSNSLVSMLHSMPDLKVSKEEATRLGNQDMKNLLENRKLVLLVDLDQTLIHTTNDNIPPKIKDVFHFQLAQHGPWYHTRTRPFTVSFLKTISKLYELHICTFGVREYAHYIAHFLDPDHKLFGDRILSRNECLDSMSKKANLSSLFPCGDNLVCIIDDRSDVWNFAPNVVQVMPYHFFQHTGDINAPPGLQKKENDHVSGGYDFTNIGETAQSHEGNPNYESETSKVNIPPSVLNEDETSERNIAIPVLNESETSKGNIALPVLNESETPKENIALPVLNESETSKVNIALPVLNESEISKGNIALLVLNDQGLTKSMENSDEKLMEKIYDKSIQKKNDAFENVPEKDDNKLFIKKEETKSRNIVGDNEYIEDESSKCKHENIADKSVFTKIDDSSLLEKNNKSLLPSDYKTFTEIKDNNINVEKNADKSVLEEGFDELVLKKEDEKSMLEKNDSKLESEKNIHKTMKNDDKLTFKKEKDKPELNTKDEDKPGLKMESEVKPVRKIEDNSIAVLDEKEVKSVAEMNVKFVCEMEDLKSVAEINLGRKSAFKKVDKSVFEKKDKDKHKAIPVLEKDNAKSGFERNFEKSVLEKNDEKSMCEKSKKSVPGKQDDKPGLKKFESKEYSVLKEENYLALVIEEDVEDTISADREVQELMGKFADKFPLNKAKKYSFPSEKSLVKDVEFEAELLDVTDNDDYLLYLEDILKRLHVAFYDRYDSGCREVKTLPDLKELVPQLRKKVLSGVNLVFSGIVPQNIELTDSKVYHIAVSLGATVSEKITAKSKGEGNSEDDLLYTTHVVAANLHTEKVHVAKKLKYIKVVSPNWLWCCAERWDHVDERLFDLNFESEKDICRVPPMHCYVNIKHEASEKSKDNHPLFESLNPLAYLSNAETKSMEDEVDDVLSDDQEDQEDQVKEKQEGKNCSDSEESGLECNLKSSLSEGAEDEDDVNMDEDDDDDDDNRSRKKRRLLGDEEEEEEEEELPSIRFRQGGSLPSDQSDSDSNDEDMNAYGDILARELMQ